LFHIFLSRIIFAPYPPPLIALAFIPADRTSKELFIVFFPTVAFFFLFWSRLIQFNKFLRATVNQLEKRSARRTLKAKIIQNRRRNKFTTVLMFHYHAISVCFFYLFFLLLSMERPLPMPLEQIEMPN
jgi:hypothetical protein